MQPCEAENKQQCQLDRWERKGKGVNCPTSAARLGRVGTASQASARWERVFCLGVCSVLTRAAPNPQCALLFNR